MSSLHFIGKGYANQYEQAIWTVGQIIEPYDYNRNFPVFGFGGIPRHMNSKEVSHCFAINGDPQNPNNNGIK